MVRKGLAEIVDVNRELQVAIKTGKVLIGSKETIKAMKKKEAKIVIHSSNCPVEIKKNLMDKDTAVYEYPANSRELGVASGKPYPVASLCIVDLGNSEIFRFLGE